MIKESKHFGEMREERQISSKWIEQTLQYPDLIERKDDGTIHYIKKIDEFGGRWLRIVVAEKKNISKLITVFFDRTLRRKKNENKSG